MSYDLHITKRERWFDKGNDIADIEWHHILSNHPDLIPVDSIETTLEGERIFLHYKNSKIAKWQGRETYWFFFSDGEISIANPDDDAIQKTKSVALSIKAKVLGDDGEEY